MATAIVGVFVMAQPVAAATDRQIIYGFNKTVFGAEYTRFGIQSNYIRKFRKPVRFYIHSNSSTNRTAKVRAFIRALNRQIKGLRTVITESSRNANFHVYIVDRKDYISTVQNSVFRGLITDVPGKCYVATVFTRGGIQRSDAVIVSDEGEKLFSRCMIEEILQGLGPLNDDNSLGESIFNDRSQHTSFTKFDRYILNMLYDPRIRPGMSNAKVQKLLPTVLGDIKKRF